ncbi:MFS transporter [Kitasatospora kifunensis]|uniref:DHA2 family multidrug resistance protein-like MFS transporter n=1 Tax=Kitasatospora kifunensis TaxID=58351 RepID=A0A7W7R078_KITKI|nr:MFS transporter [Kitasatospora kifunensis]MBB4923057.1 DHA2 family multidrug resistance protein-like MFS transporter [Kitasatospora kifunensis]
MDIQERPALAVGEEAAPAQAGRRAWIALAVLLLPLLLVSMDVSVLYFAVPFISQDLHPSSTQQLWIFDIYGFVLAGLLITMGALGDRIGRRRLLLTGALAFSAASTLAAYSNSAATLIGARAVLGIAGATLMPSTLGLIRNLFPDAAQRSKAIAIWTAVTSGGVAIGPVLSGILLEHFWWGSVFLINLPAMLMLLVLGPILVPETSRNRAGRFDVLSAVLSLAAILPLIYGIKELARNGFQLLPVAALVLGVAVGTLFVHRQRSHPYPLVDLELVRSRAFSASVAMNMLAMFALVGMAIFLTQYLQLVLAMSTLRAALWSVLPSLLVGGMAPVAASLGRRLGPGAVMAGGFALMVPGFVTLAFLTTHSPLWLVLVGAGLYVCGAVGVMSQVSEVVMASAPAERASAAAGLLESGIELGGALGMALLGSIATALYRSDIRGTLPAGLPSEVVGSVRDSLGGADAVAGQLPAGLGHSVLVAAREAFCGGMQGAAIAAAALMAIGSVLAAVLLRGVRVGNPELAAARQE